MKEILLWIYWKPFKYIIQQLPIVLVYSLAENLAKLFYFAARNKKRDFEQGLHFVLGDQLSAAEKAKMIKEAFRVLICNEFEVLLYPGMNCNNISSFSSCSGLDNLDKALSSNRGAILLFAHFGANQMVMPAIGYRGYRMSQLSAPATVWKDMMPDRCFSRMELLAMKWKWQHELTLPVEHINIFGSLKRAFLCLRKNNVLGVAIDGGWGKDRVEVDFLGRKALFSIGALDLSRRTGCPVLPTFMIRSASGKNQMIIEPPLEINGEQDGKGHVQAAKLFVKRLESYVVRYPHHYLNFIQLRHRMSKIGDTPLFVGHEGLQQ